MPEQRHHAVICALNPVRVRRIEARLGRGLSGERRVLLLDGERLAGRQGLIASAMTAKRAARIAPTFREAFTARPPSSTSVLGVVAVAFRLVEGLLLAPRFFR